MLVTELSCSGSLSDMLMVM